MNITLTATDGHEFPAYVSGSEQAGAGVVVLPEIFGITAHIRQMADRFAAEGYRAISPDLFGRGGEPDLQLGYDQPGIHKGLAIRNRISDAAAVLDIEAAAKALSGQKSVFVTGYCWGGFLSWRTACISDAFVAASCWYGGGIVKYRDDQPGIPVQMHFGGQDPSIPLEDVEKIRLAQPNVPIHVYEEAGHAFGREGTSSYHAASAQLAWQRTLAFFAENML